MNSKIAVVTGGAGFIGSHLAEELLKRGYRVVILDNLSTGKVDNIAHLLDPSCHPGPPSRDGEGRCDRGGAVSPVPRRDGHGQTQSSLAMTEGGAASGLAMTKGGAAGGRVEFIRGSITDTALLGELFRGVDCVFHQAALASVPLSIEDPLAAHETNSTGTLNVLVAARHNAVKKVVYASSCAVYGDNPALPLSEEALPAPQSPYAVAKLAGEYYCRVFQEVYGLSTACLRYFNVYGPRQDPSSQYAAVIPLFIISALDNRPPIIYGDGEQTRDFIYVRDVVEANILAAEGGASGVLNIGRGEGVSINGLAGLITRLVGSSVAPEHQDPRPGDIKHSLADISRARAFGYEPTYDLTASLRETIAALIRP